MKSFPFLCALLVPQASHGYRHSSSDFAALFRESPSSSSLTDVRGGAEIVAQVSSSSKKKKRKKSKSIRRSSGEVSSRGTEPIVAEVEVTFTIGDLIHNEYTQKLLTLLTRLLDLVKNTIAKLLSGTSSSSLEPLAKEVRNRVEGKSSKRKSSKKSTSSATKRKKTAKSSKKNAVSDITQKHLSSNISSGNPNYRIQKELKNFMKAPPDNLAVKVGKNIRVWIITLTGAKNTIYEGEKYRLRVEFPSNYPMSPPSMYFLQPSPRHEHVYTNGDICLSLLGKDWRPTMTAQSVAISILSILSSAQTKELPQDNAAQSLNKPGQAQNDWVYHDDNC